VRVEEVAQIAEQHQVARRRLKRDLEGVTGQVLELVREACLAYRPPGQSKD
jgi:hypothetical protein